jgi:hypothetical protein
LDRLFRRRQAGPPPEPQLEPIRVYARDIEVAGWVTPSGERITDILQHGGELAFLPEGADASDPDAWLTLVASGVLIVVPPPHVSAPEKRLHRQQEQVMIRVGPYVVTGTAHLKPGFEQDLFLRATQPFLPVTDATLASETSPDGVHHDVVIVNLSEVEELKEL